MDGMQRRQLAQASAWLLPGRCCPSGSAPAAEHHSDLCISMRRWQALSRTDYGELQMSISTLKGSCPQWL